MNTKRTISWAIILILAILVLPVLGASAKEEGSSAIPKSELLSKVSKLHIPFIPNQGQMDERVKYYARSFSGTVFVTEAGEIFYSLSKREEKKTPRGWILKEELLGGRVKGVKGQEEAPTRVSYFIGNDASQWRSDLSTYGTVSFGEVYEGIEVKLKAYGRSVEKLFYVRAGAKPGVIRLRLSGAESLGVNGEGELEVRTGLGEVKFSRPVAYQEVEGERRYVEVSYQVDGSDYGFKLGNYERGRDLVIDPLLQSTYLGGSNDEQAYSIAIGSGGNVYVAGYTNSPNFPGTTGGAQSSFGGLLDAFVTKLNPTLTTILQSTYLGGGGYEYAYSIAIDPGGNVYVAGWTTSTDFPGTTGGAQPSISGVWDAFVTKLNPTLTTLFQSTYLGGSSDDWAYAIAIDSGGNVYVAGGADSTNFPGTSGGAQPSNGGGNDAFVAKLNPILTSIVQSTYLGGIDGEEGRSIVIDSGGNVYVTGGTLSFNFPTTSGGAQPSSIGGQDAFVTKFSPTLTTIVQSTYLGGNDGEEGGSIAIDSGGNVYVAGNTLSSNFPGTAGGAQPVKSVGQDAFVAKFNPTLTAIIQSTYLGGSNYDRANSIAIDSDGNLYVAGYTSSTDFPRTAGGAQPSQSGGVYDSFVTKFNPTLTSIFQSTYLGGSAYLGSDGDDQANSIAIGSGGNVYVAGETSSTNFPGATGGAQPSNGAGRDAFVAKFDSSLALPPGAATLVSPSGPINDIVPPYTWNAVPGARNYYLWVNDSSGNKINQWYTAEEAGCSAGAGQCTVQPSVELALGSGQWWVQTRNGAGSGPWSSGMSFSVSIAPPGVATLKSPSGSISSTTPTFRWDEVPGAMWYHLIVNDSKGNKINQWYLDEAAGCPPGTGHCTVSPSVELAPGSGQWWVQAWNGAGYGDWSLPAMSFSVDVSPPGQATLISPSGSITDTTPTYEWEAVAGATWYHLYVNDSTGNKINQWYSGMDLHCPRSPALCRVTLGTVLALGICQWWVETYNSAGSGPWSSGMLFTVSP
jgi:hypothetical protein